MSRLMRHTRYESEDAAATERSCLRGVPSPLRQTERGLSSFGASAARAGSPPDRAVVRLQVSCEGWRFSERRRLEPGSGARRGSDSKRSMSRLKPTADELLLGGGNELGRPRFVAMEKPEGRKTVPPLKVTNGTPIRMRRGPWCRRRREAYFSMNALRALLREGRPSLLSALASICRMRSRVTTNS
jgi:hypothetical protein